MEGEAGDFHGDKIHDARKKVERAWVLGGITEAIKPGLPDSSVCHIRQINILDYDDAPMNGVLSYLQPHAVPTDAVSRSCWRPRLPNSPET